MGGLSYQYNWDIMTQSLRLLHTHMYTERSHKGQTPRKEKKKQPNHPAENQVLQSRDLRQWRETHTIQHREDKTTAPTEAQESGAIRVQAQRDTQRRGNSLWKPPPPPQGNAH